MSLEVILDEAELFLEQKRDEFPSDILRYFFDVIKQDRESIKMINQWANKKQSVQ